MGVRVTLERPGRAVARITRAAVPSAESVEGSVLIERLALRTFNAFMSMSSGGLVAAEHTDPWDAASADDRRTFRARARADLEALGVIACR